MNFSGILVMAKPDSHTQVIAALNALEGVEVHQVDAATGRIVAVQENRVEAFTIILIRKRMTSTPRSRASSASRRCPT